MFDLKTRHTSGGLVLTMWTVYVLLCAVYVKADYCEDPPGYCRADHQCHSHDDQTEPHQWTSNENDNNVTTSNERHSMDRFNVSCQKLIGNNTQCRRISSNGAFTALEIMGVVMPPSNQLGGSEALVFTSTFPSSDIFFLLKRSYL